jgi:hypothetical protein
MAYTDRLATQIAGQLQDGEQVLKAVRATPRGASIMIGVAAGIGAGLGYGISTQIGDGPLAAALGGGIGAAAGVFVGFLIAAFRVRSQPEVESPNLVLAMTDRRFLVFLRSWLTNRPTRLSREYPITAVSAVSVGKPRLFLPAPVDISLPDGAAMALEVARVDDPKGFGAAFEGHPAR